jgi:dTDP-4-amino-4,6-dideoxygalactose transaminase
MADIKVPFQDFRAAYEELQVELDDAYHRFMESGWYVLGKEVAAFEEEYAAYCEAKHCVGVGNGLEALHLGLRAVDCGPGDEVVVASNTYIATWLAVTQVGATVVPVEPDEKTYNLNPELLEQAITPRTKVILATNLYGQACDYDAIRAVADRHGVIFATDNAQSQGARYKGRRVGGLAHFECHSFYPSKNLGAFGEAGAVTTNDTDVADRIRVLRNYGSRVRYHNEVIGYNSRLDGLQAAFLRVKLRHLDEWNARRKAIAKTYLSHLPAAVSVRRGGLRLSSLNPELVVPSVPEWADPVWHLFVIRHQKRDALQKHLADHGVQTIIHYPIPPHLSGAYSDMEFRRGDFPIAEKMAADVLSLPLGPFHSTSDVLAVSTALASFAGRTDQGIQLGPVA